MAEHANATGIGGTAGIGTALDPRALDIKSAWVKDWQARKQGWAREVQIDLPIRGVPVMARRVPLRMMLKFGYVPDPLTAKVREHIEIIESREGEKLAEKFNQDPETTWADYLQVLDGVFIAAVTQPAFTDDAEQADEELGRFWIGDVDYFDKLYVFQWAQGVDQSAADFLREQGEALGRLADGEELQLSAEPTLRVERRGGRVVGVVRGPGAPDVGDGGRGVDEGDEGSSPPEDQAPRRPARSRARAGVDHADDLRPAAGSKPPAGRGKRGTRGGASAAS